MIVHFGEAYVRTSYIGDRRVEILKQTISGKKDNGNSFRQSGYVIKFYGTNEYFKDENNEDCFGSKEKAMSFTNPPPKKEKA